MNLTSALSIGALIWNPRVRMGQYDGECTCLSNIERSGSCGHSIGARGICSLMFCGFAHQHHQKSSTRRSLQPAQPPPLQPSCQ